MESGEYYRPRETAVYDVLVTDNEGQPVEAELSLRLADLAVLALADETGPTLLERFWSQRGLSVRTSMPLGSWQWRRTTARWRRAPRAAAAAARDGRWFHPHQFADTAFWEPWCARTRTVAHASR